MPRFFSLRDAAMKHGFRLMSDPRVLRLMADPRVASTVVTALKLRVRVGAAVDEQLARLARRLHLATQDEVAALKRTIAELEARVARPEK